LLAPRIIWLESAEQATQRQRGFERLSRAEKGRIAPAAGLDRQPAEGIAPSVQPPIVRIR